MKICLLKESLPGETRVALSPDIVKKLAAKTKVADYNFRYIIHDNPTNDPKAQLAPGASESTRRNTSSNKKVR